MLSGFSGSDLLSLTAAANRLYTSAMVCLLWVKMAIADKPS
jgi:hypothetical protein